MGHRVLVVDDEALNVLTMTDILELHGWQAEAAYNGAEALDAVRARDFDAVVMDIRMPDMDGIEALREMKALRGDLKVVLMTGYSAWAFLEEARNAGAARLLPKPLEIEALGPLLDDLVSEDERVLVVDDDAHFLESLADVLEQLGYPTLRAGSLDEARSILSRRTPRVVVWDLCLEDEPSAGFVSEIRRALSAAPLVLYSGYPDLLEEVRSALSTTSVRGFLTKPLDIDALVEILGPARSA